MLISISFTILFYIIMGLYWWSQAGEDAYNKAEIKGGYPKTHDDNAYDKFLRTTKQSTQNEYKINKMIRYQIDDNEFIMYDLQETRLDGLGNRRQFTRMNIGRYPIPEPYKEARYDEDNQPTVVTTGISNIDTGYEYPFTVEKAEELHKWCKDNENSKGRRTQYFVQKINGQKISVDSYKDWLTGDFDTLYATGRADGTTKPIPKTREKQPPVPPMR